MPPELPLELVFEILFHAAHLLVISDRTGAVNLALVSRACYNVLCPILYDTLVLQEPYCAKFKADTIARILPYVRYLYVRAPRQSPGQATPDNVRQLLSLWRPPRSCDAFLDAPARIASEYFSQNPQSTVRGLKVIYGAVMQVLCLPTNQLMAIDRVARLPPTTTTSLTHMIGYLDYSLSNPHDPSRVWADMLLDACPCLTHIGLQAVEHESLWHPAKAKNRVTRMMETVRDLMKSQILRCLSLRVAGAVVTNGIEDHIRGLLKTRDPRLTVWVDRRLNHVIDQTGDGDGRSYAYQSEDNSGDVGVDAERLDMKLEVRDVLLRLDFWHPVSRPGIIVL